MSQPPSDSQEPGLPKEILPSSQTTDVSALTSRTAASRIAASRTGATETTPSVFGEEYIESVVKLRALISFHNGSTQCSDRLLQTQVTLAACPWATNQKTALKLVTDVCTRWWSTFNAIQRGVKLRRALTVMQVDSHFGDCEVLTAEDWDNLVCILKVLQPFKDAQLILEGDKYVTASIVAYAVYEIRRKLTLLSQEEEDDAGKELATNLLSDFSDRWFSNPTDFTGSVRRGYRNRQVGIHPAFMMAAII